MSSLEALPSPRHVLSLCVWFLIHAPRSAHFDIFLLRFVVPRNPEDVVASDKDLTETTARLSINPLLGVGKLNVHV